MKNSKIVVGVFSAILSVGMIVGCMIYLCDYYHTDTEKVENFIREEVAVSVLDDHNIVYISTVKNLEAGLIFYPGGKVEYTAYEPLMKTLAEKGILCVLVKMPFHLAVFDSNAADGIQERFPEVENWYIGGHSLGGAMAASYIEGNVAEYEGLILLGAYSAADLSGTTIKVLSVYGSEDKVLNKEKYNSNLVNLPDDYLEIIIDGGCHAYFGMYGNQKGDGVANITNEEQIHKTAEIIANFVY